MTTEEVTKSKDPKLVASRVFIGNLPSERTSREELEEKFNQYGNILGISIHQGFAFVQYDEERSAQTAVEAEQGCYFKGKKLDLRVASEGRKAGPRGPPVKRPHDDFMPRRPEYDDPNLHGRMPPAPWEREHIGGGGHPLDRERGPEPFRDDPFWRERFGPPPPVGAPPMDTFHRGDTFGGQPPPPKRVDYGIERPFDSVIVAVNKHLKMYAEMVERKLIELNMTVDVIFLVHDNALLKAIDDMTRRGVLYILIVQPQHEERKSITVNIMHGTPQEHRNMPLDDALAMLARNFKTYLSSLRSGSEQPSMGFLLNLLSDGKHLSVAELDRIIAHLQDRRDRMIEAEGGKVIARDITPAASNSTADQLQQRILSILGGGGAVGGGGSNVPAAPAAAANPASMLATMAQHFGLNLNPTSAAGGVGPPPSSNVPAIPGKDAAAGLKPAPTAVSASGGHFDPNLSKSLDTLLQNPALLKTLVPQASAIQAGNRAGAPPSSGSPFAGPDGAGKLSQFGGGMGGQQGKPGGGGGPPGEPDMGSVPRIRPPQPPPMPGPRGVPGPGY